MAKTCEDTLTTNRAAMTCAPTKPPVPPGTPLTDDERDVVAANLGLCRMVAGFREFADYRLPFEDRVQVGAIGLGRAVQRFDAGRGVQLSTYAVWYIRQAIQYAEKKNGLISVPHFVAEKNPKVRSAEAAKRQAGAVRFVASLSIDSSELASREVGPGDAMEADEEARILVSSVAKALGRLGRRDRDIVESRVFDGESYAVIGRRHGLSRESVRKVFVSALGRLRRFRAIASYAKGA